jgi:Cu/Ag efflux pump CusA
MLSSTVLTLLVIPAIYVFVKRRALRTVPERVAGRLKQAAE